MNESSSGFVIPRYEAGAFNCPNCGAFAQMQWSIGHGASRAGAFHAVPLGIALCTHCKERSYWLVDEHKSGTMIYPPVINAPLPHPDMPENIVVDYEEARRVLHVSPRSAAALLRLCVQKLCVALGESGKSINEDIASLVRKGLATEIQQALDIIRVTGNNAVHPGELAVDERSDLVHSLFELVNLIVETRISHPKRISKLYQSLPSGALAAVQKRDSQ